MQTQEEGGQQFLFILCLWHAYNKTTYVGGFPRPGDGLKDSDRRRGPGHFRRTPL